MTKCVLAARADKTVVEIDVIVDDALDRAVQHEGEHGIETVSSQDSLPKFVSAEVLCGSTEQRVNDWRVLNIVIGVRVRRTVE